MAGRAVEIEFDVGRDRAFRPKGERADAGLGAGELGDEGVLGVDGLGQVRHQQVEELGTGGLGRAFDDGAERVDLCLGID